MKPTVTIIMATYNRAHFIVETLQTIKNQSFTDWECLIIDDGGTDKTIEIITPILEQDHRFKFLKRSDNYRKGLPGCRNYGLDLAKGDCVIFFDDDDIVHPDNLKTSLEVIETNIVDFCHYQKSSFTEEIPVMQNHPIQIVKSLAKGNIELVITQKISLTSCTVLWKKKCFDTIRFNETVLYAEEWECYSRIISENFKGITINNVLYYNRKHLNSMTGEFYQNDPVRTESYTKAILLVLQNLKKKNLLTYSLKRYFMATAIDFEEYNLFESILNAMELPTFEKLKWQFFYKVLPLRLELYKIRKVMNKRFSH
ncbi:glycosyltransferase family 2 protein [Flavobacterium sp. LT1R49]|uniref:glycosyltransferase family 2 protein n=1 Tax=Flavobacterium arabinosi TaxID=3398737 RepID=UPI003A85607D